MKAKISKHLRAGKKSPRQLQLLTNRNMPFSYVEAYKSLRTNLNFTANLSNARCFVVTSAVPEESKSNVAVNLAVALAEGGKSVILVDCDLRKPVLHKYLKLGHNVKGLTNVLSGEAKLEECGLYLKTMNISVLTAGTIPPNPSELLGLDRMQQVINQLKKSFDYVLLDAPPVSVVTDAAVLGRMADGALLVIRSCFAPREAVQLAKRKLQDVDVKIFGAILTRYTMKKNHKNSGYSYSYSYNYYKE